MLTAAYALRVAYPAARYLMQVEAHSVLDAINIGSSRGEQIRKHCIGNPK